MYGDNVWNYKGINKNILIQNKKLWWGEKNLESDQFNRILNGAVSLKNIVVGLGLERKRQKLKMPQGLLARHKHPRIHLPRYQHCTHHLQKPGTVVCLWRGWLFEVLLLAQFYNSSVKLGWKSDPFFLLSWRNEPCVILSYSLFAHLLIPRALSKLLPFCLAHWKSGPSYRGYR